MRSRARRTFKKVVQRGRSERRSEAYSLSYVEPLSDARTKLAAFFNILLGLSFAGFFGCDGTHAVSLSAEDFRFTPELVRVRSSSPFTLSIYNAGREAHEFDSPILTYTVTGSSSEKTAETKHPGITLEPGKSAQVTMAPPPGTYLYVCRRKGHVAMAGTLIVE
jgi:plastocyanin